jgi:two-component system response regulator HydG
VVKEVSILVVQVSDAFSEVWSDLAEELGADLGLLTRDDAWVPGPDVAAVVVAAGGAEREAAEWLEGLAAPATVPCLAVGADTGHRTAAQLLAAGASDYFALPGDIEILRNTLAAAVEQRRGALRRAQAAAGADNEVFAAIIGESAALEAALARVARVLPHADATVLITGETGTGKELLARAVHDGGPRRGAPFVTVNCTALPGQLLESELFGHERGAFTDAYAAKPGLFEVASGGTILLDEIGQMAPELQAKLLRVLEDKQVRRVGATVWRNVDVRIVASTNEDLEQAVQAGTFRQDLFFRFSVITLSLPPLRERGNDAVLIAEALLERFAAQHRLPKPELSDEVRRTLIGYQWPGNVRELKNAVERALLLSPPGELLAREFVDHSLVAPSAGEAIPFPAPLREITAAAARAAIDLSGGNRSEAARLLGVSRGRLVRLLNLEEPAV